LRFDSILKAGRPFLSRPSTVGESIAEGTAVTHTNFEGKPTPGAPLGAGGSTAVA